ncbi:MAG: glutamate-5-semialdehyde dehydrogenase [Anaerolineales bacterium]
MAEVNLRDMAQEAREAAHELGLLPSGVRDGVLEEIARRLDDVGSELWEANGADVAEAKETGVAEPLVDRSTLTPGKVAGMAQGCRDVAALEDPLGKVFDGKTLPNGMYVAKKRVPLGLLGVIFESRPNVTIDIGALCIKTGNGVIMRGGKESLRTNIVLVDLINDACRASGVPADAVQLISSTDRSLVPELLGMDDLIDLVIPRGGPGLQGLVREHARMPVVYGGIGVCHLYVDASADVERSIPVIHNAKTQAPSVCNALDTVLVHRDAVDDLVPPMVAALNEDGVKVLCDEPSMRTLEGGDTGLVESAGEDDYGQEFLSLVLSVKVVDSFDEAIAHIAKYGTNHSDGILTNDYDNAMRFLNAVDSAATYVNASTRFTDGGQFGLGAEVAISTQRMHARGPMGPEELTTYKWIIQGDYHVRD